MARFAPRAIAFNGKNAARAYFGRPVAAYGRQRETLAKAALFVLPSTSAAARRWWDEAHWRDLAAFVGRHRKSARVTP